tara:strand:- start:544 stop:723 length:180 start_codon:yes stop_codon:yes gene_type:complete
MKNFNEDFWMVPHFQFESNYVSKDTILKSIIEFVEINCETHSMEDEQMLIDTLMKLVYN